MEQIEEIWQRLNEGGHHPFRIRKDTKTNAYSEMKQFDGGTNLNIFS